MPLVADYGSGSEESDDEPLSKSNPNNNKSELDSIDKIKITPEPKTYEEPILFKKENEAISENLFFKLPQTKSQNFQEKEDQIEDFVPKSLPIKQKVKISIPSLSDFKNEIEPLEKKFKLSTKSCGLLTLLPPVRGSVKTTKSFVPNVVANKNKISNKTQPKKPSTGKQISTSSKQIVLPKKQNTTLSDVESGDEDIEIPETFDDDMWQKVCGRPKPKPVIKNPEPVLSNTTLDIAPTPEKPYDGLDNEAFKELLGKTKRPIGNIKLIDINEEEILSDKDLWMTKSLTDPEMAPKPSVENPVDPTRRRKHHITYLAEQAKANEQELANSWAASKNNRLASRAKYGF